MLLPQAAPQEKTLFRSSVHTVMLHATVHSGAGHLVPDLTRDDFEVRDEGRPVEITVFSSDPQPITVVLLLDMSGSMERHFLRVRESTRHLIDALQPGDRARIGSFGMEVALSPWLTENKRILHRILKEELWPGGGTPLWNAMELGIGSLDEEPGRRVVLTLTDGSDSCRGRACTPFDKVEAAALEGEVLVYAVGMAGSRLGGDIKRLAERTGGGHFDLAADANLTETFARVAAELRQQYLIGFTPAVLDGKRHRIEVRMRKPGLTARTRADYLAAAQ